MIKIMLKLAVLLAFAATTIFAQSTSTNNNVFVAPGDSPVINQYLVEFGTSQFKVYKDNNIILICDQMQGAVFSAVANCKITKDHDLTAVVHAMLVVQLDELEKAQKETERQYKEKESLRSLDNKIIALYKDININEELLERQQKKIIAAQQAEIEHLKQINQVFNIDSRKR